MRRGLAVVSICVASLVAGGCGGGSKSSGTTSGCSHAARPKPRASGALHAPTTRLDPSRHWTLTFATSCGTFVVALQPKTSPRATASLVALARRGFFDGTIFHRIVPGFVIQGGDPTQTGTGGPGYTTVDRPSVTTTHYVKGVVAMGKTATDPPGAARSQFFVMTRAAPSLAPDYAVVGNVVSGITVVERIGTFGDPADPNGTPTRIVVVDHVTAASS